MKKILISVCVAVMILFTVGCGSADVDYVAKQLGIVDEVNALLYSGQCWIACANDKALVLYINGDESSLITVAAEDDGSVSISDISGKWSLDETNFSIFSDSKEAAGKFEWNFEQEEEITSLWLRGEGIEATFYLTKVSDKAAAIDLAKSYIVHLTDAPDIEEIEENEEAEDISEVLTEYKGISIVEAFIRAGMEPSLKNRMIFAKIAGIEDYRGTAEQNLYLIEYMGGHLK